MKISIILAHPSQESFNHAIAAEAVKILAENGHETFFHDLFAERFDLTTDEMCSSSDVLSATLKNHQAEITEADGIILIHPTWWGNPPAILKTWVDRIIRPGIKVNLGEHQRGGTNPLTASTLLQARSVIVFNTSNGKPMTTSDGMDRLEESFALLDNYGFFDTHGVPEFYQKMSYVFFVDSDEQKDSWLQEVKRTIDNYYPQESTSVEQTTKIIPSQETFAPYPMPRFMDMSSVINSSLLFSKYKNLSISRSYFFKLTKNIYSPMKTPMFQGKASNWAATWFNPDTAS